MHRCFDPIQNRTDPDPQQWCVLFQPEPSAGAKFRPKDVRRRRRPKIARLRTAHNYNYGTFNGVWLPLEDDVRSAEWAAGSVIVDSGRLELPKLGEQLLDVRIRHTKVQVRDHQLARACKVQNIYVNRCKKYSKMYFSRFTKAVAKNN